MRFIKLRALTKPLLLVWRRVLGVLPDMPDAPRGFIQRTAYNVGFYRTLTAPSWRTMSRWVVVAVGFCIYISLQILLAYLVNILRFEFIVAFFIAVLCLVLAAARPTLAYIGWLVISPLGFTFFRLDLGPGIPAISFDRVALFTLAGLLIARTLLERNRIRMPIMGEWLAMSFIGYTGLLLYVMHPVSILRLLSIISEKFDHIGLALIVYYLAKSTLKTGKHITQALLGLVVVGMYTTAFAFYEHFTGNMWFSSFIGGDYRLSYTDVGMGRACGPFLNPAAMGTFLGITAILSFHFAAAAEQRRAKAIHFLCMVAQLVGCYFCMTRSGYLSALLLLVMMPFLARRYRSQYLGLGAGFVLLAVIAVPIIMSNPGLARRFTKENTVIARVVITASTINIIKHHPLFGVGLGEIDNALEQYITNVGLVSGLYARSGTPNNYYPQRKLFPIMTSHNSILTIFAEQGCIGGAIYLLTIAALLLHMGKLRARMPDEGFLGKDLMALLMVAVVGHMLSTVGYDIRFFRYPNYVLWFIFGVAVRLGEILDEQKKSKALAGAKLPALEGDLVHA